MKLYYKERTDPAAYTMDSLSSFQASSRVYFPFAAD